MIDMDQNSDKEALMYTITLFALIIPPNAHGARRLHGALITTVIFQLECT